MPHKRNNMPLKKQATAIPREDVSESSDGNLLAERPDSVRPALESAAILSAIDNMSKKMDERFNLLGLLFMRLYARISLSSVEMMYNDHDNRLTVLSKLHT